MSGYMRIEALLFVRAVAAGIMLVLIYHMLKALRNCMGMRPVLVSTSDIFFWIVVGILLFAAAYHYNYGKIRGYMLLGVAVGVLFVKFFLNLAKRLLFRCKRCKISSYKLTEDCAGADNNRIPWVKRSKRIEKVKKKEK